MKKIRPLTLLTKLASLVKLTGRKMSRDLSNDKSLSGGQGLLVTGCGPWNSHKPTLTKVNGQPCINNGNNSSICGGGTAFKPIRPANPLIKTTLGQRRRRELNNDNSVLVSGGNTPYKPPRLNKTEKQPLHKLNTKKVQLIEPSKYHMISAGTGAYKPPRFESTNLLSDNKPCFSKKDLSSNRIETGICTYICGGTTGYKPPRAARYEIDDEPTPPKKINQG
ncbi:hypothetical protein [Pseudoalteromonas rubra]|uniref:hypothetical protein n=1 Tax=Pseudoalteromonas rubra TaxID=43658 RepID=UPI000F7ADC42|nr:hypothetical protein [Pseudoalteromonas rubra]